MLDILSIIEKSTHIIVKYFMDKIIVHFAGGRMPLAFAIFCLNGKRCIIRLLSSIIRQRHMIISNEG